MSPIEEILYNSHPYRDDKIHPVLLIKLLNRDLDGVNWVTYSIDTIIELLKRKEMEPSTQVIHKIGAIKNILNSVSFFDNWVAFEKTAIVFNDRLPDFGLMQYLFVYELYYAANVVKKIRDLDLGDEPKAYIYSICKMNGVAFMPPPLDFVQKMEPNKEAVKEQEHFFNKWIEEEEILSPVIIEPVRAVVYNRMKELLHIKQEETYLR